MPDIVGVRFKPCGKIYDFELAGIEVKKGDIVVVESELGLNLGTVVMERSTIEDHEKKLKKMWGMIIFYRDLMKEEFDIDERF